MVPLAQEGSERRQKVISRVQITIRGAVQGVGFRPFVYRLATDLGLKGWVLNSPQGVFIEAEAEKEALDGFILRLEKEKPRPAYIRSLEFSYLDPVRYGDFEIRESRGGGETVTLVLPDIAACGECLAEVFNPADRRHLYPFTNCTNCGPRFSVIESLPYDRPGTSMKKFPMCPACMKEYENPSDRRFHAQPNACPECGPQLELWSADGAAIASRHAALRQAAAAIRDGGIVAVKGLGGFHLMADAGNEAAIALLRTRKHRSEKPFALMLPDLQAVKRHCEVSPMEERLLLSPESPIVLLRRRHRAEAQSRPVPDSAAPGNPFLGIMLPYTPLHHILMKELGIPVVATSGNLADEPICIDEKEALNRLAGIADLFLVHDRPIVRHVDDSIVRVILGRELVLRRARGYAPLPLRMKRSSPSVLAVGAHLKNTVALTAADNIFVSQHIGDLETRESSVAFHGVISSFRRLYGADPVQIAVDMHPDYLSTRFAKSQGLPLHEVQHHFAHVVSCMMENELSGTVLGVSWDGTGYGPDGTVWGGEFLLANETSYSRFACLRRFPLPGGARAVMEPRRAAIGLLHEALGDAAFAHASLAPLASFAGEELALLQRMLARRLHTPMTSSAGRLFDAISSIAGLRQVNNFEGQAAMELEFAAIQSGAGPYPFTVAEGKAGEDGIPFVADWEALLRSILEDLGAGTPTGVIADRFHTTLAEIIVGVARLAGEPRVVLTGGCFQNKILTERAVQRLEAEGFRPYWHQRIPPNDGGIAPGQAAVAAHSLHEGD